MLKINSQEIAFRVHGKAEDSKYKKLGIFYIIEQNRRGILLDKTNGLSSLACNSQESSTSCPGGLEKQGRDQSLLVSPPSTGTQKLQFQHRRGCFL